MTTQYLASQVPIVQIPTTTPLISGCTNSSTTAAGSGITAIGSGANPNEIALKLNQFMASAAGSFSFGGGFGVMDGLALSTVASLSLPVASGHANIAGVVEFPGGTVTVPDNTTLGFIWLLQSNSLVATATVTPPTSNCLYIGNFTSLSGSVTVVDNTGVCYLQNGFLTRTTSDRSAPSDTPNSNTYYLTNTQAGLYHFNGIGYNAFSPVTGGTLNVPLTISGTLQLIPQDNKCTFYINGGSSNKTILLPNPTSLPAGWTCTLVNSGSTNNLILKDYSISTTYCTLTTTNLTITVYTYQGSGGVTFPSGTWTPGAFPSPAANSGSLT
jgi:hypothetical protein